MQAAIAQAQGGPAEFHGLPCPGDLIGPPQHRLHLGRKDHGVHGLGDEVIPAHIQGHDDVHVVRRRGEKHHRYRRNLPDPAAPVVSVPVRKLNVHEHQLRLAGGKFPQNIRKILHAPHPASIALQQLLHRQGQGPVILHQQDLIHAFPPPTGISHPPNQVAFAHNKSCHCETSSQTGRGNPHPRPLGSLA